MCADGNAGGGNDKIEAEIDQAKDPKAKYASLPRDDDNNWIADGWEQSFGGPLARHEDAEPGGRAPGDGLSAHDEYRGFHYVERDGSGKKVIRFVRTDPKVKQDVFFWDPESRFYQSVAPILAARLPGHVYREVNATQANGRLDQKGPSSEWAKEIARNSTRTARQRDGRALVLLDRPLRRGAVRGILGNAQSHLNDGKPILIDRAFVQFVASEKQVPGAVLEAQVVGHESGHKYSLDHYWRESAPGSNPRQLHFVALPMERLTELTSYQFTLGPEPSDRLYVRLQAYLDPRRGVEEIADGIVLRAGGDFLDGRKTRMVEDQNRFHVYEVRLPVRIRSVNSQGQAPLFQIESGLGYLMDWSPRVTLRNFVDWNFRSGDVQRICIQSGGC